MTDQGQLFNAGPVSITTRTTRISAVGTCREPGCGKTARRKQGARYCEEHARSIDHGPTNWNLALTEQATCDRCGSAYRKPKPYTKRYPSTKAWEQFCAECHRASPLNSKRLVHHNVPYELAHAWLMQGDQLRCEMCQRRLSRKSQIATPCIDHNHKCCSSDRSCGHCIRGILCVRCNTHLGAFESLLELHSLEAVAEYLKKGAVFKEPEGK